MLKRTKSIQIRTQNSRFYLVFLELISVLISLKNWTNIFHSKKYVTAGHSILIAPWKIKCSTLNIFMYQRVHIQIHKNNIMLQLSMCEFLKKRNRTWLGYQASMQNSCIYQIAIYQTIPNIRVLKTAYKQAFNTLF